MLHVLEAVDWHKGQACEILQISRPRLRRLIKEYHLSPRVNQTEKSQSEPLGND